MEPQPEQQVTNKVCRRCNADKPIAAYSLDKSSKDGHQKWCKTCVNDYVYVHVKQKRKRKKDMWASGMAPLPVLYDQPDRVKEIVKAFLENPKASYKEVAKIVGLSQNMVSRYCAENDYLRALRQLASHKMGSLIPLAVAGYEQSLTSDNQDVKLRAATKLLENENIMGPARVDISVNDLRNWPVDKLKELVSQGSEIPVPTIDAEVIE